MGKWACGSELRRLTERYSSQPLQQNSRRYVCYFQTMCLLLFDKCSQTALAAVVFAKHQKPTQAPRGYDVLGGDILFSASTALRTALPFEILQDIGTCRCVFAERTRNHCSVSQLWPLSST